MVANYSAAVWTAPLNYFLFEELVRAVHFYEIQVFYHTQMVFGTVAFIEYF